MGLYVKGGSWKNWKTFMVKTSSGWKNVTKGFIKGVSGWIQFFPSALIPDNQVTISQTTGSDDLITLNGTNYHWSSSSTVTLTYDFLWSSDGVNWTSVITGLTPNGKSGPNLISNPASQSSNKVSYKISQSSGWVVPNTKNYFSFIVYGNTSSQSGVSQSLSTTIQGPSDITVSISSYTNSSVTMSWTASTNSNRYVVYYYNINLGKFNYYNGSSDGTGGFSGSGSTTITGLLPNTDYYFYVQAATGSSGTTPSNITGYLANLAYAEQKTSGPLYVTYDANGGNNAPYDSTQYAYGSPVTVKPIGSMTYSGKSFTSWNTSADGTGVIYSPGDLFYIYTSITLYAQWSTYIYPPGPINNFFVSSNSSSITWTWDAPTAGSIHNAATGYYYTYQTSSTTPANGTGQSISSGTLSFRVDLLMPGTTKYGFVQAYNLDATGKKQYGPWSSLMGTTVFAPVNQTAPSISIMSNSTILYVTYNGTWTNSPSAYRYQWYIINNNRDGFVSMIAGATSSTYNYGINDSNGYYVLVWASNGAESQYATASNTIMPNTVTATAGTWTGIQQVPNSITYTIGTFANATSYINYIKRADSSNTLLATNSNSTTLSYTLTDSDAGYQIYAYSAVTGSSNTINSQSVFTSVILAATTATPTTHAPMPLSTIQSVTASNGTPKSNGFTDVYWSITDPGTAPYGYEVSIGSFTFSGKSGTASNFWGNYDTTTQSASVTAYWLDYNGNPYGTIVSGGSLLNPYYVGTTTTTTTAAPTAAPGRYSTPPTAPPGGGGGGGGGGGRY